MLVLLCAGAALAQNVQTDYDRNFTLGKLRTYEFMQLRGTIQVVVVLRVVPRAGVEPARPFGQRILSHVIAALPNLTKRYEPIFTLLAIVKVLVRLASYQHVRHHLSPISSAVVRC